MTTDEYVEVIHDWDFNPRDPSWIDLYTTMVCFHSRYAFGDIQFDPSLGYEFAKENWWNPDSGNTAIDDFGEFIRKNYDIVDILPIYLLDHSGLTIRHYPFSCGWDSAPIGFIFMTKEKAREAYGVKYVTKKIRERVRKWLISEIEEYDRYLRGVNLVTKEEAQAMEWQEICREFKWEWIE